MLELIQAGGFILYITIFSSIIALGFTIERFLVFRGSRVDMTKFFPPLENYIRLGRLEEALRYCESAQKYFLPRLLLLGLRHKDEEMGEIRQVLVDDVQSHTLPFLQKNLGVLAIVAKAAPMLGLLGTILGMMTTFEIIAIHGLGDPSKMATGIRLALVTTAGGLMVAIPFIFAHSYFCAQIRDMETEIYQYLTHFLRILRKYKEAEDARTRR